MSQTLHRGFRTQYNVERNRARLYPYLYPSLRMGRVKSAAEARMGASAIDDGSSETVFGVQSIGCDFRFTTVDVEGISRISYEGHLNPERRWVPEPTHAFTVEIALAKFVIDNACTASIFNRIRSFMNVLGPKTTTHCGVQSFSQVKCQWICKDTLPKHLTVGETVNITMCGNLAYEKVRDSVLWLYYQVLGLRWCKNWVYLLWVEYQ
ncbi:hypothetical protein C8J55DRAFT_488221 [Lentinula edodes]|uniref:Uncharacterized protein n=1 Tax=Lentinula lateritia TaxID=40482 RepID=A0A9W9AJH3_9AGAR|nr:hypothetical protein C8J55DRAFT_488221 [Lentinula edodes]